jgi:hypothetical protein
VGAGTVGEDAVSQIPSSGKVEIEVIAAASNSVIPTPKIDLRDAHAIRRELGSVYRDMRSGRITSQDGTRLAYVLDLMRKAYETAVLEDRVITLEAKR